MPARVTGEILYAALSGSPSFLGVIAASTTKNNHDTATPFNNTGEALNGKILLIQADATCFFLPGITNATTVTEANGVRISQYERVILTMTRYQGWLAAMGEGSGAVNLRLWELF